MSFVEILVIITLAVILILYTRQFVQGEVEYVKSTLDGRRYLVRSLPDKQQASDMLADINKDLISFINHLRTKFPNDENYQRLYQKFDPNEVSEGTPDSAYTSYTINKSHLVICVRQTDYSFVDKNVVMYPAIHELGHMACKEVGHTQMFWTIFKGMINEAMEIGLYKKMDFKGNPQPYCGIVISSHV
jgi:hypothetical protein